MWRRAFAIDLLNPHLNGGWCQQRRKYQLQGSAGQKVGNWKRRQTWNGGICRRSLISLSQSQPQSLLTRYLTNPSRSLRQITTLTTTLTFLTIKSPPPSLTPPPPSLLHNSNICHQCNCDDCKVETRGFYGTLVLLVIVRPSQMNDLQFSSEWSL